MDKKKRTQAQQASIRSSRGRSQAKATKGHKRYAARPAKPSVNKTEVNGLLSPQAAADGYREEPASALPNAGPSFFGDMGGIDGILSMMGKAQQMFRFFQQIGPLIKMFGAIGGPKATTASLRVNRRSTSHRSVKKKR